jgi:outer membrane immunogenic protein
MKKVLLGGVALITLGFVGAAVAADMPVKAPPPVVVNTWTGYYVGGNIGGGEFHTSSQSFFQSPDPSLNPFGIVFDPVNFNGNGVWGVTGGVHAGYNWQLAPSWLVGVEGDWDKANAGITGTEVNLTNGGGPIAPCLPAIGAVVPLPPFCRSVMMSQNLEWTASVRARLGYIWGSALFYGTGGVAFDSEERSGQVGAGNFPGVPGVFNSASIATSYNTNNTGWVAGGGLELMATANWLVRVEYLHYAFNGGSTRTASCSLCTFGAFAGPGNFTWGSTTFDVVRAGLSYKF